MTETTVVPQHELAGDYVIDPDHSRIGFTARHAMVTKVRGSFDDFTGTARIGVDAAASCTTIVIRAASITTNQKQRDTHLRSADFLDVDNHPEISFRSTEVEIVDPETYRVVGDLTIRHVTRPVSIDFEFTGMAKDPMGNVRAGFEGTTTISREEFGVSFNAVLETGGVMVSNKVVLQFDVSAIKQF